MSNDKKMNVLASVICGVSAIGCFTAGTMMTMFCKKFMRDAVKKGEK